MPAPTTPPGPATAALTAEPTPDPTATPLPGPTPGPWDTLTLAGLQLPASGQLIDLGNPDQMKALARWGSEPLAPSGSHGSRGARHPALDYRARWSLGVDPPPASSLVYDFEFWWAYVEYCRALVDRAGVAMRTHDRALWQSAKEHQLAARRRWVCQSPDRI